MSSHLKPRMRKESILLAAIRVARRPGGWSKLTRSAIAREANCSDGLVSAHLGSMTAIRRTVMKAAVKGEMWDLVAQGLAVDDPIAKSIANHLKAKAFAYMLNQSE